MQRTNKFSIISLTSLVLMFCLPFMVSYHKWPVPDFFDTTLSILLGLLALIIFTKPTFKELHFPIVALLPALLSLIVALQWFVGVGNYWQAPMLAVLVFWWSMLLMITVSRLKEFYELKVLVSLLAYGILIGGTFNVLVVFMQLVDADHFFWTLSLNGKNYAGNLAQVNHLTNYISLSIISLFYLYLVGRLKIRLVILLLVVFLATLNLTGSRMSWLYILMIVVSFFYFGRKSEHQTWKQCAKLVLLIPVLYAFLQIILPFVLVFVVENQQQLPPAPTERLISFIGQHSVRMDLIKEGLDIFKDHPLLGIGWGQFAWYDLLYADTHPHHQGYVAHTHNLFVQLLAECGILAGLLLFIGSVYWLIRLLKQDNTVERWWILLVVGVLFAHSMLEYPLWYPHFLGIFVVVVTLADKDIKLNLYKPIVPSLVLTITMLISLNLLLVTVQQYKKIETWIRTYPTLSQQQRFVMLDEMTAMQQATLIARPLHMVLTRAYSVLPNEDAPLKFKIAKYESLLHYVQADRDLYRYVLLLAFNGQTDKAVDFLRRVYARQPGYAIQFSQQLDDLLSKPAHQANPNILGLRKSLTSLMQ